MKNSDLILLEIINHIVAERPDLFLAIKKIIGEKTTQNQEPLENIGQIFDDIYKHGLWGKSLNPQFPFFSGNGTHSVEISGVYISRIRKILSNLTSKPDVVDLGCGDFLIGSQLRDLCKRYIACDIVPSLIEYNQNKYQSLNVEFIVLDLISENLPEGEIAFIRQVFQHLSNAQIRTILGKLKSKYKTIFLTEHWPKSGNFIANIDKIPGANIRLQYNSGVVITKPPFDFEPIEEKVICDIEVDDGRIVTIQYVLNH